MERPFFAVPHLSCRFLAVPPRFSPVFHDFGQKRKKNGCPKMEEPERKERVPFPFFPVPIFSRSLPGTSLAGTMDANCSANTYFGQLLAEPTNFTNINLNIVLQIWISTNLLRPLVFSPKIYNTANNIYLYVGSKNICDQEEV